MLSARALTGRLAIRTSLGALAQARSTFRRLPAEQASGIMIDWRKADGTVTVAKDHRDPVWASVPIETEPCKCDTSTILL